MNIFARIRIYFVGWRAKEIWKEKGQRFGFDRDDWSQAEAEYRERPVALVLSNFFNILGKFFNIPDGVLKSADLYLKILIFFVTLIAGLTALANYNETTRQDRLKISLSYADRYEQEYYLQTRDLLTNLFGDKDRIKRQQVDKNAFENDLSDFIKADDHQNRVMRHYYMFDELSFCANAGLCNHEYLCGRFSGDVKAFRNNFLSHFQDLSTNWQECLYHQIDKFLLSCGATKLRTLKSNGGSLACQ